MSEASANPQTSNSDEEREQEVEAISGVPTWVDLAFPWMVSFMMHLGMGLIIMFAVYMAKPKTDSDADREQIIVPTSDVEGDPNGVQNPGTGGDPTRDAAQNLINKKDLNGWSQQQADEANVQKFLGSGDSGDNVAEAIMNGSGGSVGGVGKGLGGSSGGPLAPFGTPGGGTQIGPKVGLLRVGGNAYKVVYILDRSGGMVSTWRSLASEVRNEVTKLKPIQSFAIIMCGTYDNLTQQTGYQAPFIVGGSALIKAEKKNKEHVFTEMENIKVGDGNDGTLQPFEDSFNLAFRLKPQLVYFLTDGAFDPKLLEVVTKLNKDKKVHINTIAYGGAKEDDGTDKAVYREQLRRMASENGGLFAHITDDMLQ